MFSPAKRKLFNYFVSVIGAFLFECVSFAFMGWGFGPTFFYLDFIIIAILCAPIFFFKNTIFDMIYLPLVLIITAFFCCLNANYYVATGTIFAIQDFHLIFDAIDVLSTASNFINIPILLTEISILVIILFFLFFINIKFKFHLKRNSSMLVLSILSLLLGLTIYPNALFLTSQCDKNINNNVTADYVNLSKNLNFRSYGMFSYYIKDFQSTYIKKRIYSDSNIKEFCLDGKPQENDFTGLLSDVNVITVMIETGAITMLNDTLTPNLYYLTQNGVNCSHNYSKNKTNVAELSGITGNYTSNGINFDIDYALPFSLPNILKDKYDTMFFHDVALEIDKTYHRHQFIPKLGFEKSYFHEELYPGVPSWDWNYFSLDSETTQKVIEIIDSYPKDKPYYVHYTTLTMHGTYVENDKNKDYFDKLNNLYKSKLDAAIESKAWVNPLAGTIEEKPLINYMLKVMDFDAGLGNLVNYLEQTNQIDNTLLILYGDHDVCYTGVGRERLSTLIYKTSDLQNIKLYQTILTFYNPKLNALYREKRHSGSIDPFTSPDVIVPTTLDLLGINYSTNLYFGDSIFNIKNDDEKLFYSFEISAFMNEHYFTQNISYIEKVFNDNNNKEMFLNSAVGLMNKLMHINDIYSRNFFKDKNFEEYLPN